MDLRLSLILVRRHRFSARVVYGPVLPPMRTTAILIFMSTVGGAGLIAVFWFFLACYGLGINARRYTRLAWMPLSVIVFETIRNVTEVDVFTSVRVTFSLTIVAAMVLAQMAHSEKSRDD